MSREIKLLKNTGIIAIGQLSSRLLSFLLLPLYTNLLLPDDFGLVDVLQSVVSLLLYFATLQLESAIFRFMIEKRDDKQSQSRIISSGVIIVLFSDTAFTILIVIINIFCLVPHMLPFIFSFWGLSLSAVMLNIARGNGHNALYSLASFSITVSFLIINIILIIVIKVGAVSILWALCISNFVGAVVVYFVEKVHKLVKICYFDSLTLKEMLNYSLPLIPNAISWWVANASDRFIIVFFMGSAFNGLYAVANKIPTIYLTLFNIFNLAWTESVIVNIYDKDNEDYINAIFKNSLKVFSFFSIGLISGVGLMFDMLIGDNYNDSYNHILILVVAAYVSSLCSMYGGVFSGFKDSKSTGISTVYGAIVNILINLMLIRVIGLYAASFSTLISYIVILFVRHRFSMKYVNIFWPKRFITRFIIIILTVSGCYLIKNKIAIFISIIITTTWGITENKTLLIKVIHKAKDRIDKT